VSFTVNDRIVIHGRDAPCVPARFAARVELLKAEAFEVCGALALGESILRRLRLHGEAAQLAAVFEVVEGRLVGPTPYEGGESGDGS
jgi:hypothetical protein